MKNSEMINVYLLILGFSFVATGIAEFVNPGRLYNFWNRWINNRLFFLHGLVLITFGFPLIMYDGHLSSVMFFLGCTAMLSGPFILIYPEKLREFYSTLVSEMEWEKIEKLVYCDGSMRISIGSFMIFCYLQSIL